MQIPVFAIRLLRLSSLDSHELEQSSIPVAKGKAMFPNSSIIDTLEQMTESEEQFLDPSEIGVALEAFREFCDREDLKKRPPDSTRPIRAARKQRQYSSAYPGWRAWANQRP